MTPDEPEALKPLEERLDRQLCGKAVRAAEVPIFDERELRLRCAQYVIAASDRRQADENLQVT